MSLKISRILHAGYVFEFDGARIAFDPIFENPFSRNCHAFPDVRFDHDKIREQKFDAVFISHFHDDHCSLESLDLLDRKTQLYVFCVFEEMFQLIRELGFTSVHSLRLDFTVVIGAITVTAKRAVDADVDSMFHIQADDLNVLNVVDSWMDPEVLAELCNYAPWDLVLWPFQTMRELEVVAPRRSPVAPPTLPEEWREQLQSLAPKFVVPSSCQFRQEEWSWYNHAFFPMTYRQFAREVSEILPEAKVVRLNPSVSIILDSTGITPSAPLEWVKPVGDQEVDYVFLPEIPPPLTAEIAKHFEALTSEQSERARNYCQAGLLEKFRSMEPTEESYFHSERLWRLSIFDHDGIAEHFLFRLMKNKIEPISPESEFATLKKIGWTTEIPAAKLYAALELGETLTSLYIRINDFNFDLSIEAEVNAAEIIEDPLIRCLYTGVFGAYQRAQLKRLRGE